MSRWKMRKIEQKNGGEERSCNKVNLLENELRNYL